MSLLLSVLLGLASPASPANAIPWECDAARQRQAQSDAELVKRAYSASPTKLSGMLPDLQAALARAPAGPLPRRTVCGGTVVIHSHNPMIDLLGEAAAATQAKPGEPRQSVIQAVPYEDVALLVGSILDGQGRYEEAISALRRGDELLPGGPTIAPELAFALAQAHRSGEAAQVITRALDENAILNPIDAARLHRTRGYALGELGRYDEAIADYRASQKLDPKERLSANEIAYLEGRKAGRGPSQIVVTTSDKVNDPVPTAGPTPPPT